MIAKHPDLCELAQVGILAQAGQPPTATATAPLRVSPELVACVLRGGLAHTVDRSLSDIDVCRREAPDHVVPTGDEVQRHPGLVA